MTNYSKTTNFTAKDSLVSGDANKIVKGSEIDAEFDNIATASATKANIASPAFTGVVSFPDGTAGDPSITNTGDTNTGLFFSAADTLAFSAAGTAQFTMADGAIAPVTDNDVDLGTSSLEFKDGYFDGTLYTDAINLDGTAITSTAAEINILDGVTATAAELNILDGVTSTAAELNILDGVTSTAAELNILDGVTATTVELNYNDTGSAVGTVVASKVVTVDANKDVASFRNITLTGELDAGSLDISGDADIDGTLETDALSINGTAVTSTAAELNILDGVTSTAAELNILDGVTSTTAELNILDGVTSTAAELNILDGVTSTTAELNILDGVTSTAAELNILDGKAFLDEDDMSSNSATGIASQQSIKAYVDAQITAEDLDFQADSGGALSIDLDSETLTFTGGTGIDTSGSGQTVTFDIDSTVATLTGTQTLTNKTLTSPDINTPDIDGGTIDNTTIGASTAAAGTFTSVVATGLTVNTSDQLIVNHSADGGGIRIDSTNDTNTGSLRFGDTADNYIGAVEYNHSTNVLSLYADNATRMSVSSTGIDVTGSVTADGLTVSGDAVFTPDNDGVRITGASYATLRLEENDTTDVNTTLFNSSGDFVITTSNDARSTTVDRFRLDHATGDIGFYNAAGSSQGLFWDASAESLSIGITNPTEKFTVVNSSSGIVGRFTNNTNQTLDLGVVSGSGAAGGVYYNSANSGYHAFQVGGSEAMRISGGNVGIGTSSPSHLFTVKSDHATNPAIKIEQTGNTDGWGLAANNNEGRLEFSRIGGGVAGTHFTITNTGNVGIQNSNPPEMLTIGSTSDTNVRIQFLSSTTGGNTIHFGDGTSADAYRGYINYTHSDDALAFAAGGAERMRIDSGGTMTLNSSAIRVPNGSAAAPSFTFANDTNTGIYSNAGDNIAFSTAGTMRAFLSASQFNVTGNGVFSGSISKGSGSFKIDHPLPAKTDTHHLVHSFVEAPQADNIYRGSVDLVGGSATVNIDTVAGMTDGTFVLLNTNVQCFTSNESGWTAIKGSVSGNTLTITAQDNTCTDTISWMVVGERQDQHMLETDWTDENGKVIVEPIKPAIED